MNLLVLKIITIIGLSILNVSTIDMPDLYVDGKILVNKEELAGLYNGRTNTIYINSTLDMDTDFTLYHEIGHALFINNSQAFIMVKDLPLYHNIWYYIKYDENRVLNEQVADYFAYFITKPNEFSIKYPCLYIYFKDELNKLNK